jgi:hypothetical protein
VCRPGEPWGSGGRWIEQWDEAAALDTIRSLVEHWHKKEYQVGLWRAGGRRGQCWARRRAAPAAAGGPAGPADACTCTRWRGSPPHPSPARA